MRNPTRNCFEGKQDNPMYILMASSASSRNLNIATPSSAPTVSTVGVSLIPFLLPDERPLDAIKRLWPHILPPGHVEFHRVFKLNFIPQGLYWFNSCLTVTALFARLSVRFLETTGLPMCIWRGGIICALDGQKIFLEHTQVSTFYYCVETYSLERNFLPYSIEGRRRPLTQDFRDDRTKSI